MRSMILSLALSLIASLPASPARAQPTPGKGAEEFFKNLERSIPAAEKLIQRYETLSAAQAKSPAKPYIPQDEYKRVCVSSFTWTRVESGEVKDTSRFGAAAAQYQACIALSGAGEKACPSLGWMGSPGGGKPTYAQLCGDLVAEKSFIKAIATGSPTLDRSCHAVLSRDMGPLAGHVPPERLKDFCAALAKDRDIAKVVEAASSLATKPYTPVELKQLRAELEPLLVDGFKCSGPCKGDGCCEAVAFRKARLDGGASCGDDKPFCRAAFGVGPRACAPLFFALARQYCDGAAVVAFSKKDPKALPLQSPQEIELKDAYQAATEAVRALVQAIEAFEPKQDERLKRMQPRVRALLSRMNNAPKRRGAPARSEGATDSAE